MKQVVDIQARSHLLKKNQQKENRYKRLFYRVAFHCLCKGTKKLQLRFIFIKILKNQEILLSYAQGLIVESAFSYQKVKAETQRFTITYLLLSKHG